MAFVRPRLSRFRASTGLALGAVGLSMVGVAEPMTAPKGDVAMLGLCSYDSSQLACWTPSGRRDAGLVRQVDRVLRSNGSSSFQYRYAMKNRLLVFSSSDRGQVTFSSASNSYFNSIEGRGDDLGPNLKILTIAVDPDRKTGSISATYPAGEPAGSAATPLKDGAEAKLSGGSVRIGLPDVQSYTEPPRSGSEAPTIRRTWIYPLTVDSPAGTTLELRPVAIDGENRSIDAVDAAGRPIPAPEARSNDMRGFSQPLIFIGNQNGSRTGMSLLTTIDPAFVREVRWSATLKRRTEFNDFALDPRR